MHLKLLAHIALSSTWQNCSSLAASDFFFANVDVTHSVSRPVWFFCDVTAKCVRTSNGHLLIIFVPVFFGTSPAPRSTRDLFPSESLSLNETVFPCIRPCFARRDSLNDRSDFFGIHHSVAVSLIHMMQALRILDSLPCVNYLQYLWEKSVESFRFNR